MARGVDEQGRTAQKRRTRKAIVAATAELLAKGLTPSVNEVAIAADVSRRTVYMYFPTMEQLLIDATLLSISEGNVGAALDTVDDDDDIEHRVDVMVRAVQRLFVSTEPQGRMLLRLTVEAGGRDRRPGQPVRGYRRVEWIERALAPLRERLEAPRFERLVSALAMVVGWESLIVARDIRALGIRQAEEVSAWAAQTLVRATLEEAGLSPTGAAAKSRPARRRKTSSKRASRPRRASSDPGGA
ncbi:MAG: TetR/AcrR family transcriptional regulator [Gemmatimonadaceae bacterium]